MCPRASTYKVFCYLREVGKARFNEIAKATGFWPENVYTDEGNFHYVS
jgi:hypothetical protein